MGITEGDVQNMAKEVTRSFMRGLMIGVLVGGGFMTIVSVIAFIVALRSMG